MVGSDAAVPVSRWKRALSKVSDVLALAAPVIDSSVFAYLCWQSSGSQSPAVLGWTPQHPMSLFVMRMVWLLVALVLVHVSARRSSDAIVPWWSTVFEQYVLPTFTYVFLTLLGVLCIIRLVTDHPVGATSKDAFDFWVAVAAGACCTYIEGSLTLEVLPSLRQWLLNRVRARQLPQRDPNLDVELLEDASGVSSNGPPVQPTQNGTQHNGELGGSEKGSSATIKKLLLLVAPDWPLIIQASILLTLAAIADVLIPRYIGETIALIIEAEETGTLASRPFKVPIIKLLISAAFSAIFSSCRGATFIWLGCRASIRLRQSMFDTLIRQEIGFFDTTKTGELTSRMTQDCQKVTDQITLNINVFLRTLVSTVTTLIFMTSLTVPLTMVAFVSVPVIVVISKKYGKIMQKLSKATQEALAEANAVAEESLSTMATVRSFAAEELESKRFAIKLQIFHNLQIRRAQFYIFYLSSTMMLPQAVTALVLFYGGKLAMEHFAQANSLVSFVFYLQTLNGNFSTIGDFYTSMVEALGAATRVFDLLDRQPKLPLEPEQPLENAPEPAGKLCFKGVRFTYPARPEIEVLKGLELEVPAGRAVALVGPSGNGKSTIVGLLQRLYKAQEGSVTLDGVDLWKYEHSNFHRLVSIVGQEPVLYARTVEENILYGLENPVDTKTKSFLTGDWLGGDAVGGNASIHRPDAAADIRPGLSVRRVFRASARRVLQLIQGPSEQVSTRETDPLRDQIRERVRDACCKANAHNFISKMPEDYATQVGERGVQLSGGQKQRIAIARALVRKPKVLLLDEATSALDAKSESQVQKAIDAMIVDGSMTVIIIAHRLSTVQNSHKICVIEGGLVVEHGSHQELLGRKSAYFKLVQCQLSAAPTDEKGENPVEHS